MGYKDPEKRRAYGREWRRNRRAMYGDTVRKESRDRKASLRARGIALLGGKCLDCGATKKLEFDHIVPRKKTGDLTISTMINRRGWAAIEIEVRKCELRCQRCHIIKTTPTAFTHGTIGRYGNGCRCEPCRAARHKRYIEREKITTPSNGLSQKHNPEGFQDLTPC